MDWMKFDYMLPSCSLRCVPSGTLKRSESVDYTSQVMISRTHVCRVPLLTLDLKPSSRILWLAIHIEGYDLIPSDPCDSDREAKRKSNFDSLSMNLSSHVGLRELLDTLSMLFTPSILAQLLTRYNNAPPSF